MSGIDATIAIRREFLEARIISLTAFVPTPKGSGRLRQGRALSCLKVRLRGTSWKQSARFTPGNVFFLQPNSSSSLRCWWVLARDRPLDLFVLLQRGRSSAGETEGENR